MIPKSLIEEVTKEDIDRLVADGIREIRTIECKTQRTGNSLGDRKEFLADVSSFANAVGGDIVYGVTEVDGVPQEAHGLSGINPDEEVSRIENMIRAGIAPRIPGVRSHIVTGFDQGPCIVVRIPRSWAGPHMVTLGTSRFFTRSSNGKYPLDVNEIRLAFASSEEMPKRAKEFRDESVGRIIAGDTPVHLIESPRLILHIVPFASFYPGAALNLPEIDEQFLLLRPIGGGAEGKRLNADGYLLVPSLAHSPGGVGCYTQFYRDGKIEAVGELDVIESENRRKYFHPTGYEGEILNRTREYLPVLQHFDILPPFLIMLTLIGLRGSELAMARDEPFRDPTPFDRDVLDLPASLIEDCDTDVSSALRPVFDALWNAGGHDFCRDYDENGIWNPAAGR